MSRLTMQEVIEHCEKTAKRIEENVKYCREWLEMEQSPLKSKNYLEHKQTAEWLKELQRYKDLEEQGRLLEMPCKPSELVWEAHEKFPTRQTMYCCNAHIVESMEAGYCIGYTKEEAEQKLAELKGGGDDEKN